MALQELAKQNSPSKSKHFDTEIISCDSRQFFKEMKIGTAMPTPRRISCYKTSFCGQSFRSQIIIPLVNTKKMLWKKLKKFF